MASNDGGGDGFAKPAARLLLELGTALPPRASNPALPAGMAPKLASDSKLSQDDFRRLMMTPRDTPGAAGGSGSFGATPRRTNEQRPGGGDGHGRGERRRPDGGNKKDAGDGSGKPKYRDRAKERRLGLLGEYEESAQILNQLAQSADGDESGISYEKSKYLGGDVAHTHLVKGLDYALLEQVKKSDQAAPTKPVEPAEPLAGAGSRSEAPAPPPPVTEASVFEIKSEFAKRIVAAATQPRRREPSDMFLPGRQTFQFDLEDTVGTDLPTIILRSKADLALDKDMPSPDSELVLQKIRHLILSMRQGNRVPKAPPAPKAKPATAAAPTAAPPAKKPAVVADDDDDIFPDAGRFNPTDELAAIAARVQAGEASSDGKPALARPSGGAPGGWIRERGREPADLEGADLAQLAGRVAVDGVAVEVAPANPDDEVGETPIPTAAPSSIEHRARADIQALVQGVVQSAPQAVDAMAFAGTRSTAARETARVVDDYDYGMDDDEGYGVTAYDSDEEADYSKMDRGASAKRTQLTRFDFDTEEEFAAYKDSQEAAPKAAFQFGIKTADGRKTRRGMSEKQKLDRDLQKINQIIRDQYNRPDFAGFGVDSKGGGGGGGGGSKGKGKRRRDDDDD